MPSVGGLTIEIEAVPDTLAAPTTPPGGGHSGTVSAKLTNYSLLPIDADFQKITSSDDKVATADRIAGTSPHVISVSARPGSLTAAVGQLRQENIASWKPVASGKATLTAEFRVVNRFGTLLGTLTPSDDVAVT